MRFALASFAAAALAVPALALDVGEKAPELDVTKWFGGDPVVLEQCAGKKVVVVEVFGTFCEPCKKAVPRLSRLAEKYGASGLEVVAVSDEKPDVLEAFFKEGKVKYRIAVDEERNTITPYMHAVGNKNHAPYAYVLDKTGCVVWRGNPSALMDRAVAKVLSGKLDAEKAKELVELETPIRDYNDHKEFAQAAAESEKLLAADPGNEAGLLANITAPGIAKEPEKCKAFLEKHLPLIDDDQVALNFVAWTLATAQNFPNRHPAIALKAAKRAAALSEGKDAAILDTLARCYYVTGMLDEAIDTQKKAFALDETDEEIKKTLDHYLACSAARAGAK